MPYGTIYIFFLLLWFNTSLSLFRIFWESKKFEGSTTSAEPWYNTSYSVENVTPSVIQVRPFSLLYPSYLIPLGLLMF